MFGVKNLYLFVVIFLAVVTAVKCKKLVVNPVPPPLCGVDCRAWMRCSPYTNGPVVWSIVDGQCRGFNTPCLFDYENCGRSYYCMTEMTATNYDDCKNYCEPISCTTYTVNKVCARFTYTDSNNAPITDYVEFLNDCELNKYSCENMKPYTDFTYGVCPP